MKQHREEHRHVVHAAPKHEDDSLELPPGYSATSIPGVYQYTAPGATKEARYSKHTDLRFSGLVLLVSSFAESFCLYKSGLPEGEHFDMW